MKGGASMIPGQPDRACAAATPQQLRADGEAAKLCCGLTSTALSPSEYGFLVQSRKAVAILK